MSPHLSFSDSFPGGKKDSYPTIICMAWHNETAFGRHPKSSTGTDECPHDTNVLAHSFSLPRLGIQLQGGGRNFYLGRAVRIIWGGGVGYLDGVIGSSSRASTGILEGYIRSGKRTAWAGGGLQGER